MQKHLLILLSTFFLCLAGVKAQKKVYAIINVTEDSSLVVKNVVLEFDIIANDSFVYPLYDCTAFINIRKMKYNFFCIGLEKLDEKDFKFKLYTPSERIEYVASSSDFGKIAKAKELKIKRSIYKDDTILPPGMYRTSIELQLGKYNKTYSNYVSQYYYFTIRY